MAPFVGRIRWIALVVVGSTLTLAAEERPPSSYSPTKANPMSSSLDTPSSTAAMPAKAVEAPKPDAGKQPVYSGEHNMARAGNPRSTGRFAKPGQRAVYTQGYIGGSLAFRGDPPLPEEGVWGWDYTLFRRYQNRIFLGWSHGRPNERAEGRYLNTNPFHVPNIFEFKIIKLPEGGGKE